MNVRRKRKEDGQERGESKGGIGKGGEVWEGGGGGRGGEVGGGRVGKQYKVMVYV